MSVNSTTIQAAGRQPRGIVRINGTPVSGWISWEVTSNSFFEADTFRVSFATSALPKEHGLGWFLAQRSMAVEILAGFPADPEHPSISELKSLIYGTVDDMEAEPVHGLLSLCGRDLTASLIDTQIDKEFSQRKASDIAFELALSEFLTPVVTATRNRVGTADSHGHVLLRTRGSKWDLLCRLAQQEGFVCYVTGNELHFEPDIRETAEPYLLQWHAPSEAVPSANAIDLRFRRSMTAERGAAVTVKSFNPKIKKTVTEVWPPTDQLTGAELKYQRTMPAGTDSVACLQFAKAVYAQVTSHAMRLQASLPADDLLTMKTLVRVQGTGTALDQLYHPLEIRYRMSIDEGYTMELDAQNHSPDMAPTEPMLQSI